MEARRLVVRLADGDDRGEVAVFLVLKVLLRGNCPLDPGLDVPVFGKQFLDPPGGGGSFSRECLVLIVDNKVDASLRDLFLHRREALLVDVELSLLTHDMTEGQDGDDLRRSSDIHFAPFEGEKVVHFLVSPLVWCSQSSITPLSRVITVPSW